MRCAIWLGHKWCGTNNNLERKQDIHHLVKCIHEICQHIYRVDWSGSCGEQPESQSANFHAPVPSISTTGIWSYICRLNHLSFVHLRQFQIRVHNRAVESESRKKSKNWKKSDLISYPTFWQNCHNAIKCQNVCTSGQGPASEYLNI